MIDFLFAMTLTAIVVLISVNIMRDSSSKTSAKPLIEDHACSCRATLRAQSECENRCVDKHVEVAPVAECRIACAASAAMYLRTCELSGRVTP